MNSENNYESNHLWTDPVISRSGADNKTADRGKI
jgi:hypothetical protein